MSTTIESQPLSLTELRLKLDRAEERWLKAKDLSPYDHEYTAARMEVLGYRGLVRALTERYGSFESHTDICIGCPVCWDAEIADSETWERGI